VLQTTELFEVPIDEVGGLRGRRPPAYDAGAAAMRPFTRLSNIAVAVASSPLP
jgi:hypothetical protein